jgi:hypothetical protein
MILSWKKNGGASTLLHAIVSTIASSTINQEKIIRSSVSTYLDSMEGAKVLELRTPLFFLRRTEFRRPVLSKLSVSR